MEEAPVTAATGALGPVIAKLSALLGSEYKLRWRTRRDVKFIRSKLKPVHSLLWNIWEREELDEESWALKIEALDLADDVDDSIVDFMLSLERSRSNKRLVQTKIKESPFRDFKKRASDVSVRCCSKWKKKPFSSLLSCGKMATDDSRLGKPRAYPFVRKDASELVGMVEPRDELILHLVGDDESTPVELQLKMAFIHGMAGMGKTTLADLVYQDIGNKFQSRAFVSVTRPGGKMREVLQGILEQLGANISVPLAGIEAATEGEQFIDTIPNFLEDKRYLVIIDDLWNWREWEMIMKSLPENNLGSRIVGTTRINAVAEKWWGGEDSNVSNSLLYEMLPLWNKWEDEWIYKSGNEDISTGMVELKADLVGEGFDYEHPIVYMCGGMPLALQCMLSAVAQEREKQAQAGLCAKACDVQDEIQKQVMENGIQNTLGLEPLVESLHLGFDDLPHPMLKTCLSYCCMYRDGYLFERKDIFTRWASEGFVCKEEEANSHFEELVNRGWILSSPHDGLAIHPMMRIFLRQDKFITYSSQVTSSYNTSRIRRLCIDNSPCISGDAAAAAAADPLSALDWNRIRSLVFLSGEGIERVPFEKLEGLRALDISQMLVHDHHLKNICGLVRLRHLFGLNVRLIVEVPPEIVRLQCLESFQASAIGEISPDVLNLSQLKTLEVDGSWKELPREIGALQQLETLRLKSSGITKLPREVWSLQQLKILDISNTMIRVLPKEIAELQQLRTLDISNTEIKALPKEMEKLQRLEHLFMSETKVAKIPRALKLKEVKSLELDYGIAALPLEFFALVELPECIHHALEKSDLFSDVAAGEMVSFKNSPRRGGEGGLVVGAKHMSIPSWIREHFNDLAMLDIRICKLDEQGLKILREMPRLEDLTLRLDVVPREPAVITSGVFPKLWNLTVDSRVPRVTFQEGAMPKLQFLTFEFQFYAGPPNEDPVGIKHLESIHLIVFKCNEDWYGPGGDSPCIRSTIDVVRKEALENLKRIHLDICGRTERLNPY